MITITGPGGVGKTRLLTYAAALVPLHSRASRYVSLADAPDKEAAVHAVTGALGLEPGKADNAAVVTALESLGGPRLLLTISNS